MVQIQLLKSHYKMQTFQSKSKMPFKIIKAWILKSGMLLNYSYANDIVPKARGDALVQEAEAYKAKVYLILKVRLIFSKLLVEYQKHQRLLEKGCILMPLKVSTEISNKVLMDSGWKWESNVSTHR